MPSLFVEGVPIVQIRRSNVHITFVAPENVTLIMALNDFRAALRKSQRVIAEHDAKTAEVVSIRRKR